MWISPVFPLMSVFCFKIPTQGLTLHLVIMSPWSPLVSLCLRLYLLVIDLTESQKVVFALVFPCQLALSPLSYPIFREQVPKSSPHSMRIKVRNPRERKIYLYYLEFFCKQFFPFTALFSCSSTCLHQYGPVHTYLILGL